MADDPTVAPPAGDSPDAAELAALRQEKADREAKAAADREAELAELPPESQRVLQAVRRFEGKTFDLKLKGRVWRFLISRGFSSDAVGTALQHLKTGASSASVEAAIQAD